MSVLTDKFAKLYFTADDEDMATRIFNVLLDKSKWMEITPMPDGQYEFAVKNEPGIPAWPRHVKACSKCLDRPGVDGIGRACRFCNGSGFLNAATIQEA
jgi:hypothetical protein